MYFVLCCVGNKLNLILSYLTVQSNGECVRKRSEEESTGRMEWAEKNVRSDLRQESTS